jgi:hypothetical protein
VSVIAGSGKGTPGRTAFKCGPRWRRIAKPSPQPRTISSQMPCRIFEMPPLTLSVGASPFDVVARRLGYYALCECDLRCTWTSGSRHNVRFSGLCRSRNEPERQTEQCKGMVQRGPGWQPQTALPSSVAKRPALSSLVYHHARRTYRPASETRPHHTSLAIHSKP